MTHETSRVLVSCVVATIFLNACSNASTHTRRQQVWSDYDTGYSLPAGSSTSCMDDAPSCN